MRIDFYVLNTSNRDSAELITCRLIDKAYQLGHTVFVCCDNSAEAARIDELLWTYKDDSFVPHHLQGEGPEPPPPVQIGFGTTAPQGFHDVLLNLSPTVPTFHTRFRRIIEVVLNDEASKTISRQHYRAYRNQNFQLHTHSIDVHEQ